jgi:hypothetical protein
MRLYWFGVLLKAGWKLEGKGGKFISRPCATRLIGS